MDIDSLLEKPHPAAPIVKRSVMLDGELVSVRFRKLRGDVWRDLKAQFTPRSGSFFDQNLGYNVDAVAKHFPGVSIEDSGGRVDELKRVDAEGNETYLWPSVFTRLEDDAIESLVQAMFEVHQLEPQQVTIAAGKALRAGRAKKRV